VTKAELVLSVGAEGGSIAVYGDQSVAGHPRYRVVLVDQTPTFLNDEDGGVAIRWDSGFLPTWQAASEALARWPWPNLHVLYVHPSVAAEVWSAVQDYVAQSDCPVRPQTLDDWRGACAQTGEK
jgi:hypothetical protein